MLLPRHDRRASGGFTLIELTIAAAVLVIVLGNVYMVLSDTQRNYGSKTTANDVDVRARRTLDRIAAALVGASRDTLTVAREAPENDSEINFATSLGIADGVPMWSNPQRIALSSDASPSISWVENPGEPHETRVIWSRDVRQFAAGDVPNGIDDNGNGLIDEKGLSFAIEGNSVRVTLTIERPGANGKPVTKTLSTLVTCRNGTGSSAGQGGVK
jgi:hypothetical protein